MQITPGRSNFVGAERITDLSASTALTVPIGAYWAIIRSRTQAIHIALGGGAATTADMLIPVGEALQITSKLSDVRIIEAAASASIDIWFFR